jgi:hypothetical protein
MATPSYRERQRAARAEARAKREAEKAAWHRRAELVAEVRRLARDAVIADIRPTGDRVSLYKPREITAQANELIGPWLIAKDKARLAERNAQLEVQLRTPRLMRVSAERNSCTQSRTQ